jgi:hypothetical protein
MIHKLKEQSIEQAEPNKQMGQEKIDKHSTWKKKRWEIVPVCI